MNERQKGFIAATMSIAVGITCGVILALLYLHGERKPNPDNFRPVGTVARVADARVWPDGNWYALAGTDWSGSDLVKFVPDDFIDGTNPKEKVHPGTWAVQTKEGWKILPHNPPH